MAHAVHNPTSMKVQALLSVSLVSVAALGCGDEPNRKSVEVLETQVPDEVTEVDGEVDHEVEVVDEVEPKASLCDAGPVTPTATSDFMYPAQREYLCLGDKARLCEGSQPMLEDLLACKAVAGGWYTEQGSVAFRVMGRAGGECVIAFLAETEGGGRVHECRLPLPMSPWEGLSQVVGGEVLDRPLTGIESYCTTGESCSLLFGGPNACDQLEPKPPLCALMGQ